MDDKSSLNRANIFFWIAFFLLLLLNWILFKPILGPLIFGAILAGSFYPVFEKIMSLEKIGKNTAASLTCLLIMVMVFFPLTYLVIKLSSESLKLYQSIAEGLSEKDVTDFLFGKGVVAELIKKTLAPFNIDFGPEFLKAKILPYFKTLSTWLLQVFNNWVGNFISFCFDFIIMLLVIFGFFSEGQTLKKFAFRLSPLPDSWEQLIVDKFNQMNHVTLVCNGIGGVLQGGLATIGFAITGVSSLSLWFTLMSLLAFVPLVGISFVYIPASIYFLVIGKVGTGTFLFIYCTVVSLIVEKGFKPKFIGKRVGMSSLLVLLYIIGGMSAFGMAGIFYGPLICTIFLTAVGIYHEKYTVEQIEQT